MKNAGKAPSAMNPGTITLSTKPPRRHAATIPTVVPTMNDSSSIHDNTADYLGGGIYNKGTLVGATDGGNVYDNHPENIYHGE